MCGHVSVSYRLFPNMWPRLRVLLTVPECVVTSLYLMDCAVPGQVESIHPCGVTDNNGTSLNIRWKPPRSFQGVLTGYIIRLFRDDVCVNLTYLLENKSSDEKDYVHEHKVCLYGGWLHYILLLFLLRQLSIVLETFVDVIENYFYFETHKRVKQIVFISTQTHSLQIFVVILFVKLQNDT